MVYTGWIALALLYRAGWLALRALINAARFLDFVKPRCGIEKAKG